VDGNFLKYIVDELDAWYSFKHLVDQPEGIYTIQKVSHGSQGAAWA
jgi:hypothetical protein